MKIHGNTPTRLEVGHRPVFWAVVFGSILFVLAAWGFAGFLEGEWMAALFAFGLAALMGWLVFRHILLSFSLVLNRDTDRIIYHDTKGVTVETPLARLTSVACEARLDTDNGEARKALVLKLGEVGDPTQIRLSAFKLRTEDVLDAEHAITRWLGQDAGATADGQRLEISIPVPRLSWLGLVFCAFLIANAPVALISGELLRAAVLFVIGCAGAYVWLEKVMVRQDLTFDPARGVVALNRSNVLGKTTWLLPLQHLDGAELIEQAKLGKMPTGRRSANVDLLFRNTRPNLTLRLSPLGIAQADAERITAQINGWVQNTAEARA